MMVQVETQLFFFYQICNSQEVKFIEISRDTPTTIRHSRVKTKYLLPADSEKESTSVISLTTVITRSFTWTLFQDKF